jgi:cell division protein FtsB
MMRSKERAMWTRHHKNRNTGRLIVPAISALFLAYFGFHAYHGEFGIYSRYRLEERAVELQAELDHVKAERMEMERRVQLMHDGTLEKDMLDEQARRSLNLSHVDEITIMLDSGSEN